MRVNKGSLSKLVLDLLEKSVDGALRIEDFAYNSHIYAQGYERNLSKSGLSKAINRLRNQGFIEDSLKDNQLIIKLTKIGIDFLEEGTQGEKSWDGKWRIVIFDIPENKRVIRNLFRRNLKKWGFKPLQKSVWVCKKDIFDKIKFYVEDLNLGEWVTILESNNISPLPKPDAVVHQKGN